LAEASEILLITTVDCCHAIVQWQILDVFSTSYSQYPSLSAWFQILGTASAYYLTNAKAALRSSPRAANKGLAARYGQVT
jgi:hypothetical protein